ncbi:FHA domain-containing protein [Mycobacterium ulcerans]|uniref:FHA domain-containing protein n=1 Tax=Mycobacterium ulcerans TaxID=1809 RepID=UPI0015D63976|nr:FHA domain-containing protein [Mycobacterium ulcerans]
MTRAQRPVLTVRSGPSQRSFAAGPDVIVGSDLHADLRVAHPLIDRAHLLLRFEQGSWVPIDNNSQSGIYVDGRRVPLIDIRDGLAMNLGRADGPRITFEVGHHQGVIGLLPPPETIPRVAPADRPPSGGPSPSGPGYRPGPPAIPAVPAGRPRRSTVHPTRSPAPAHQRHTAAPAARPPGAHTTASHYPDRTVDVLGADSGLTPALADTISIGRAASNDIVVSDVLASRHHAFLTPTRIGTEIRDAHSINGTFVNGIRVGSAILSDGDIVTIGNVDLAFTGGTLARHTQVATRAGGLEVNAVNFSINGNGLLENISLTARPGTLTAVIGGSGAGKTTLSRLIAGYTSPSSGTVTFEGHNIHADYASLRSRIGMVPQDDVVHRKLTVNQALGYAAELRLPPRAPALLISRLVSWVDDLWCRVIGAGV